MMGDRTHEVRVLVVEDAPEFRMLITRSLEADGFVVEAVDDGEHAIGRARTWGPDVIVLDLGLPKMGGLEVCRQVRTFSDAYVVMLTARSEEVDRLIGLAVGADDYMIKPFSPRELVARIRAMLRRSRLPSDDGEERVGDLSINSASREVRVGRVQVELTRVEFELLNLLSSSPTVVFSRARLLERVWGPRSE